MLTFAKMSCLKAWEI